jgi:uncharacterized membrane protein
MSDSAPPDPAAANPPESTAVQPASSAGPELQPNIAAALACFFSVLGGIIFLVLEKKNKFVRFYAMQSFLFGLSWFALCIAIEIMAYVLGNVPLLGWLLHGIFWLALVLMGVVFLAVEIITIMNAFNKKEWEIPYIGKFARKQLVSGPLSKL